MQQYKLQQIAKIHSPDFILVQETRLSETCKINIQDYTFVRNDANETQVGTAIAIRVGTQVRSERAYLSDGEITLISYVAGNTRIAIGSFYIKPNHLASAEAYTELLNRVEDFDVAIIGGDFNTPSGNSSTNTKAFNAIFSKHPHIKKVPSPLPTRGNSFLDFFIIKDDPRLIHTVLCKRAQLFSDHHAIILSLNGEELLVPYTPPKGFINYDSANWDDFNELVELKTDALDDLPLTDKLSINSAIKTLTEACNEAINLILRKPSCSANRFAGLPEEIAQDLESKAKISRLRQRQYNRPIPHPGLIQTFTNIIQTLNQRINKAMFKFQSDKYHKFISSLTPSHRVFADIKRITKPSNCNKISELKFKNNSSAVTPDEICSALKEHSEDLYKRPNNFCNLKKQKQTSDHDFKLFFSEISLIIKNLKNKFSAGPDNISNRLIKKLSFKIQCRLTRIITACIKLKFFPTEWKKAKMVFLFKKGDKKDPANYRPISMVSNLGKILEKVIQRRLCEEVEKLEIIPQYQCGFRAGHSTLDAAAVLRDKMVEARSHSESLAICLIDIAKAFDSVWHKGLCHKLRKFGISDNIVKLIQSFLNGRTARVWANGTKSSHFRIQRGVPQGTILGPILYNIFVADQPAKKDSILQYADDTALISNGQDAPQALLSLQDQLTRMEKYYEKWGIKINGRKTELTILGKGSNKVLEFTVAGEKIKPQKSFKYLGINFNKLLSPHIALKGRLKLANAALFQLRAIMKSNHASRGVKRLAYQSMIRPVLTYGCPLWAHAGLHSTEIFERKVLRQITGMFRRENHKHFPNPLLYHTSKIPPIADQIHKLKTDFQSRYIAHKNELIHKQANADDRQGQKIKYTANL